MTVGLLSMTAFARTKGWSQQYVSKLVKQGKITLVEGKVDPEIANAALQANRDPGRANTVASNAARSGRARSEHAAPLQNAVSKATADDRAISARLKELEYERRIGELVTKSGVERAIDQAIGAARETLLAIPARLHSRIAAESDPRVCFQLLDAEVRRVVNELADAAEAIAGAEQATRQ